MSTQHAAFHRIDHVALHVRARRARSLAVGDFFSALPGRIAALAAHLRSSPSLPHTSRSAAA